MTGRKVTLILVIFTAVLLCLPTQNFAQKKKLDLSKGKSLLNKVKKVTKPGEENKQGVVLPSTEGIDEANSNKRKLNPPDVNNQIANAKEAIGSSSYSEARFYIKEAIRGIELEIGHSILSTMPLSVLDANSESSEDVVYSTGVGFAGMEVSRTYYGANGMIRVTVANSSALNSAAALLLYEGNYSSNDETVKVTRYRNNKAFLEVDEYNGFKMSVPFGQSSIFIVQCEICQTEDQLIDTADQFDLENYKTLLGEK